MSHASAAQRESYNRLRAFYVTPLVLLVLVVVVRIFIGDEHYRWSVMGVFWELLFLGFFYIFLWIGFVVFLWPAIEILLRIDRLTIWTLTIAGMAQGVLLACLIEFLSPDVRTIHGETFVDPGFDFHLAGRLGLVGLLVAAFYGIVAKIRFR